MIVRPPRSHRPPWRVRARVCAFEYNFHVSHAHIRVHRFISSGWVFGRMSVLKLSIVKMAQCNAKCLRRMAAKRSGPGITTFCVLHSSLRMTSVPGSKAFGVQPPSLPRRASLFVANVTSSCTSTVLRLQRQRSRHQRTSARRPSSKTLEVEPPCLPRRASCPLQRRQLPSWP